MNARIFNRDFQHPDDGIYQIEPKGVHLNKRAGVEQIIDDAACASIVNRFNKDADKPGFAGVLIDHEHFKHQPDKETIAYGWLMRLENRKDGIYAKIRWTGTGQKAVDNGDYRFFSTEYDGKDMEVLNSGKPMQVRPLALAGLTLTNDNNNKGQKPITNRMDTDQETGIDTETEEETPAPRGRGDAVKASFNAATASDKADSPAQHEDAAVLHRKAEKAQRAVGHATTADYHRDMAEAHDKTAASIRAGANCSAANRGAPVPAQNSNGTAPVRLLATQLQAQTGKSFEECWNTVRAAHPEMFGINNRDDVSRAANAEAEKRASETQEKNARLTEERNRVYLRPHHWTPAHEAQLANRQSDEVMNFRAKEREAGRELTYEQAHNAVRRQNPALFPLGTAMADEATTPAFTVRNRGTVPNGIERMIVIRQ
jgi:hypothetical protein